jgi:hypothetical protein
VRGEHGTKFSQHHFLGPRDDGLSNPRWSAHSLDPTKMWQAPTAPGRGFETLILGIRCPSSSDGKVLRRRWDHFTGPRYLSSQSRVSFIFGVSGGE